MRPTLVRRPIRFVVAAFASTVVVGGAALAPRAAEAATPPSCLTAQLVATVGNFEGAAGTDFGELTLTNLGVRCTLRGYPGLSGVDLHGRQIGASAKRLPGRIRTITLAAPTTRGLSSASTKIGISDGLAYSRGCAGRWAAGLRVYPPGQRAALAVPYTFRTCAQSSEHVLSIEGPLTGASR